MHNEDFHDFYDFAKYYQDDKIKKEGMDTHVACMG
jgi:hypothetical protein